jgi:integrase/recombinase XerD
VHAAIAQYLTWLRVTNRADATVRNRRGALERLLRWCQSYRIALFDSVTNRGDPLGWGTQAEYLGSVRAFLGWCFLYGLTERNAASTLQLPRRPVRLPIMIMNTGDVERVLRLPSRRTPQGLRDRAILEVLYSTGLRRAEVARLHVQDVDQERRVVYVRSGKGQRDRVVPIGRRALRWVQRYLRRARPVLVADKATQTLFLTARGRPLRLNRLSERVRGYLKAAGLDRPGSCHLFRHTMATHLLDGGADVRDVQEILGHSNLSTTARYTHVSIARLQRVHARAHPAERRYLGREV